MNVAIGKVYRCNDPRGGGRTGIVVELDVSVGEPARARLLWLSGRRTWVKVVRLRGPAFSEVSS